VNHSEERQVEGFGKIVIIDFSVNVLGHFYIKGMSYVFTI